MASKRVKLPDGTDIMLVKHPRARNIKLTVTASGHIRVAMPGWIPYGVGLAFAKNNSDWIAKQSDAIGLPQLRSGHRIGKSYRLVIINDSKLENVVKGRIDGHMIKIQTGFSTSNPLVQKKAAKLCEQALRQDSETILVPRLYNLAIKHNFVFSKVTLRKLSSRWGSCTERKNISLNIFLVQLPQELIDYVMLHELVHTKHLNHGQNFWATLEELKPATPHLRKRLKKYRPRLQPA